MRPFHVMLKPRGALCDLECAYCYYLRKEALYPGSDFRMSDEVLEEFTRQYIESQLTPEVVFVWQGGEPTLMGLDFYRRAVQFQTQFAKPGMRILNTLQTNGASLDDEWCAFFRDQGFLIGISVDGPRHLHDAYRVDKGGRPTYERTLRGLELLRAHGVEFNVLTTVHAANVAHPMEVYRHLRDDLGVTWLQFIPIVEPSPAGGPSHPVSERSVTGREYGDFLVTIFDEWVREDVGTVFVQIFDVALAAWSGHSPGLCVFEETCGHALALEHNGDLYACDHFVEPEYRLGNVLRTELPVLADDDRQRRFGRAKRDGLPQQCRSCEVRFVCNGGCPKNRILETPEGEPGLNWLCEGYLAFFRHVDPAMRFMAAALRRRRPPSAIKEVLAAGSHPGLLEAYGPAGEVAS
ncbi:MAG: anaerobic sulfatase maturase [Gemmatimonadales bacterium]|nr:MAG: anaerobic sulfatase maturase [Gemmatimonadales bacterium]